MRAGTRARPATRWSQSYEPGEDWFWNYETEEVLEGPVLPPPHHRPLDQPAPGPAGRVPRDWKRRLH